jgi:hypothetical protein
MKTLSIILPAALVLTTCLTPATISAQEISGDLFDGFEFTYPEERIEYLPGLAEQMATFGDSAERNFGILVDEMAEAMPESAALANLQHREHWSIAGDTDALMSLGATIYGYSGGAHGNTSFASLLWDVTSGRAVMLTELFTDRYGALAEIDARYCSSLLDMQRERERGLQDGGWGNCPLLHEQIVFPAAEPGEPFTQFQILIAPYIAGSYADGPFEISVPVTSALLALVRPEYRDSFALPTN